MKYTMSNYPAGVTGGEYEIAGPDFEWERTSYCVVCDKATLHQFESYRQQMQTACTVCGGGGEYSDGPDEDRAYDEWKDDQHERLLEARNV